MTNDDVIGEYVARASGSVGCEILDPDGEVVAWTVDGWWAAVIVGLLNGAEEGDQSLPAIRRGAAALVNGETRAPGSR
jgi:hypothetical protein